MPFGAIAGHEKTLSIVKKVLQSGKLAHAYLFAGPDGVGKRKTALAFLEAAFCGRDDGCGTCPSCRKIAAGCHPDIHFVSPDGQFIKIDQIRELQKELSYRPYESSRKACIIDGADRLNPSAGNALLKTLEEPPGNALMLLLAESIDSVLPTIRSRCQHLLFTGVPEAAIRAYLSRQGIPAETAHLAASLADGSVGKAVSLCDADILQERVSLMTAASSLTFGDIPGLFAATEPFDKARDKALLTVELLTSFWLDMLRLKNGSRSLANSDLVSLLEHQSAQRSTTTLLDQIAQIGKTRQGLLRNAHVRLAMDQLYLKLAA